ncbi:MAG: hypothetical protein WC722_10530 [Rhodospirillales bacterium]
MRHILLLLATWLYCLPAMAGETVILSQRDDPLAHIAASIVSSAFHRIALDVLFKPLPPERALQDANKGETAGDIARIAGIEKQYANLVMVPEPLLNFDTLAFTTGLSFKVDGWESLRPYRLCVLRAMKLAEQGTEGMDRILGNDSSQIILMLRAGRCDVGIFAHYIWPEVDRLQAGPLRMLEPPISSLPLYLYLNKSQAALGPRLAEALRQMRRDGSTDRIIMDAQKDIAAARSRNEMPAK